MDFYTPYSMPFLGYGRPKSYKTLDQALELIKQAISGEKEDELFYDYLISAAPTQEEKDIIAGIRDDEKKHNKMFREIYEDFTGEKVKTPADITFEKPASYMDGIRKAFFGELAAAERYRDIIAGLPNRYYRDMVFEIMTDELEHADKYNYIINRGLERILHHEHHHPKVDNKADYTPDDWVRYIGPLVNRALAEAKEGINLRHLFEEFILSGVLVGRGMTPGDAIEQVEVWEKTGQSKLLQQSKMMNK